MSAGLPGAGLAGLFLILSGILAIPVELVRTVQGRSSRAAWMHVARQAGLALAMLAAVDLGFIVLGAAVVLLFGQTADPWTLPIKPGLIALAVLAGVASAAKVLELALRCRRPPRVMVPARGASRAD